MASKLFLFAYLGLRLFFVLSTDPQFRSISADYNAQEVFNQIFNFRMILLQTFFKIEHLICF